MSKVQRLQHYVQPRSAGKTSGALLARQRDLNTRLSRLRLFDPERDDITAELSDIKIKLHKLGIV